MSNEPEGAIRPLPERPNLRHLKDQAKDLLADGEAESLAKAQYTIARSYGFPSWAKLKAHVESLEQAGELKQAIDAEDFDRIKELMIRNPALHRAPLGYGQKGPLSWVAECRIPWRAPSETRLAIAQWMIENGSDVHQGGDMPLGRAALRGERIPMMELLVRHGADVNGEWDGNFPNIWSPCESVNAAALRWLLEHGANPETQRPGRPMSALDYLIGTYGRSAAMAECIDALLEHGGTTRYDLPGVLATIQNRTERLGEALAADPGLVERRYAELDCGSTGSRRLLLQGATLLHVAAEFGCVDAAGLLLDRGADVNVRAAVDEAGVGGQTPIFHAVTQYHDWGLEATRLLLERGADLSVRARIPGAYERPGEVVECTPLEYALRFPGEEWPGANARTVELLREWSA